ncbi:competence protein ComEA helix-hairpin-helix repeat protein [Methylovorus sp. MP688]|nr:competence protein ComEA helix-hairpin-helix repeat protein [Methylovorus sp. MP688]
MLIALATLCFALSAHAAVNINTASKEELETVKGIGPAKAQAIIDYRKKNGNFKTVEDLNNVPGFGDKSLAKLKGQVSVVGKSAAGPITTKEKTSP